ncbi:hypothetical protein FXO37_12914 [Capsicum annuum]|nr:hypothetical protein FXO37_12914 [Capsicum annuum]
MKSMEKMYGRKKEIVKCLCKRDEPVNLWSNFSQDGEDDTTAVAIPLILWAIVMGLCALPPTFGTISIFGTHLSASSQNLVVPIYTCEFDIFDFTLGSSFVPVTNDYKMAYVNGASHWTALKWNKISLRSMIVLFNMHDETLSEMTLPTSLINELRSNYDELFLFCQRNHIFLTSYSVSSVPSDPEIANDFVKPMAIRKNGEILWEANRRKRLLISVDM